MSAYRQEVLNVLLAQLLQDRGVVAFPEPIMDTSDAVRAMPDVLVSFRGLRLAVEGEVGDRVHAQERAWDKARQRLEQNIAHIGVAVVYPSTLRHILDLSRLKSALAECRLTFSICNHLTVDQPDWQEGNVARLCDALELNLQQLLPEDTVRQAAQTLREGVEALARAILDIRANVERIAAPLGIEARTTGPDNVARIAALVLANALLFQEELSRFRSEIPTLRQCMEAEDVHGTLSRLWKDIYERINYQAIFCTAYEIMLGLSPDERLDRAFRTCADRVACVACSRVALQHDLVGRLYHLLLGDIAKPLGTYYTSVPAATILLRLALAPKRWSHVRWTDPTSIASLRIADLACGTGTLLMAAVEALKDNFLRTAAGRGRRVIRRLLKEILTDVLWGLDVLPSAVHLTAATLMLPVPEVVVPSMHLYAAPLGKRGRTVHLGSLDFLWHKKRSGFVPLTPQVAGQTVTDADRTTVRVELPPMDLVCMNPPFTRSVGGNLLFGSLPPAQRRRCQKELQRLLRETDLSASATAGLGSVFLALADRYLKPDGRLAFVLPKALLSGIEWKASRRLLADHYVVETVVVSHDPKRWNFSENTDLSEVLIVARKRRPSEPPDPGAAVTIVNLWYNPDAPLTALAIADKLRELSVRSLGDGDPAVRVAGKKMGEAFTVPWDALRRLPHWLFPCAFAQWRLNLFLLHILDKYQFSVPGSQAISLRLVPLQELGELGPDRRDIFDGFHVVRDPTDYPALWGHDANRIQSLNQSPNAYLSPLGARRPGRPLRDAQVLWNRAGSVLIAERLRLNTQRVAAVFLSQKVLSNVWWPVALKPDLDEAAAKALVLWLNSTPGLLVLIGHRLETEGAWVEFKKPTLHGMPVLDIRRLDPGQREALAAAYDRLAQEPLCPFPRLAEDSVREAIDKALSATLGLPDLTWLRRSLAVEPILTLRPLRQEQAPAFRPNGCGV